MKACVESVINSVKPSSRALVSTNAIELLADALVLVGRRDVKAGQFAFGLVQLMQRHAGDRIFVRFKNIKIADGFFDARPACV